MPLKQQIFDEILVNAADNKQRDPAMDRIDVVVEENLDSDPSSRLCISVTNNGQGIPVEVHEKEGEWMLATVVHQLTSRSSNSQYPSGIQLCVTFLYLLLVNW